MNLRRDKKKVKKKNRMEKNHQDGALGAEHVRQIGTHGVQRTEEEIFFLEI